MTASATRRREPYSPGERRVAGNVVRRQRFLEPRDVEFLERAGPPRRVRHCQRLVGVDHDLEVRPDGLTHGGDSRHVRGDPGLADLELHAGPTRVAGRDRTADELLGRKPQPAALGVVDRYRLTVATGHAPQGLPGTPAADVPQGGVDGGERECGDDTDAGGPGGGVQLRPQGLDVARLAAVESA